MRRTLKKNRNRLLQNDLMERIDNLHRPSKIDESIFNKIKGDSASFLKQLMISDFKSYNQALEDVKKVISDI